MCLALQYELTEYLQLSLPVGCTQNSECPVEKACVNQRCVSPCEAGNPCGSGARCLPTAEGPSCSCPEGFTGDPYTLCQPAGCSQDSQCPSHQECQNQQCQDPCKQISCITNAKCFVKDHIAKCQCLEGYLGDPDRYCSSAPVAQCKDDQDCPAVQGCIDDKCQDLCQVIHPCGSGAICKILDNHPMKAMTCSCPEGFDGDPHYACTPSEFIS